MRYKTTKFKSIQAFVLCKHGWISYVGMRVQNNGAAYYKQSYLWRWQRRAKTTTRNKRDGKNSTLNPYSGVIMSVLWLNLFIHIIVSVKWIHGGVIYAAVIINIQNNQVYYHGYSMSAARDKEFWKRGLMCVKKRKSSCCFPSELFSRIMLHTKYRNNTPFDAVRSMTSTTWDCP